MTKKGGSDTPSKAAQSKTDSAQTLDCLFKTN